MDQRVTISEVAHHVRSLVRAVQVPLSVDAERCYADNFAGIQRTVTRLAEQGAAGVSIEDYDPAHGICPIQVATLRVKAAVKAAHSHGIVLTARAENHLYGIEDLDDTISRLQAFRRGGADVVYAPGAGGLESHHPDRERGEGGGQRAPPAERAERGPARRSRRASALYRRVACIRPLRRSRPLCGGAAPRKNLNLRQWSAVGGGPSRRPRGVDG